MHRADAERRGQRKIRNPVVCGDPFDQLGSQFRVADPFADKGMKHGSARIARLQRRLQVQRLEQIIRVPHRQLGRIGVIRSRIAGTDDFRIQLARLPRIIKGPIRNGKFCHYLSQKKYTEKFYLCRYPLC